MYKFIYSFLYSIDDDFRARIVHKGFKITRYPLEIGRYYMAKHTKDQEDNTKR
jgi:hypothetical protein